MNFLRAYTRKNNLSIKTINIKEKYICKLCNQILHRPKVTQCSCNFCSRCLNTFLDGTASHERLCPSCGNVNLNEMNIFDDKRMELKLELLEIVCPHRDCAHVTSIASIEEHVLNECENKTREINSFRGPLNSTGQTLMLNDFNNQTGDNPCDIITHFKVTLDDIGKINNENTMKIGNVEADLCDLRTTVLSIEEALNQRTIQLEELRTAFQSEINAIKEEMVQLQVHRNEPTTPVTPLPSVTGTEASRRSVVESQDNSNSSKVTFHKIFSQKSLGSNFWSDKFVIQNYSFRLMIQYKPVILVYLYLTHGLYDELAEWPLRQSIKVNIKLNDQDSGEYLFGYSNSSREFQKNFQKPISKYRFWLNECDMKINWRNDSIISDERLEITVKLLD